MKKITLIITTVICTLTFAQKSPKVDLDKFYFNGQNQNLPTYNIPFDQRTYYTTVELSNQIAAWYPDPQLISNKIYLHGWKYQADKPTLLTNVNIDRFTQTNVVINTRVDEQKDKDGKVTSRNYYYSATFTYSGIASFRLTVPEQQKQIVVKTDDKTEAKPANRFLTNKTENTPPADVQANNRRTNNYSANYSNNFVTPENTNRFQIEELVRLNSGNYLNNQIAGFINSVISQVNYNNNANYGFALNNFQDKLWIIDSKEEEGQIQKDAIEAVKVIFAQMKADVPLNQIEQDIALLIEYFNSLKTKYPDDNKGSRKIRYSAYYNLGKIYYYLDMPEKAIIEGQGLINNGYDEGDGERIIKDSNKLIEEFNTKNFKTKHNITFN